MTVTVRIAMLFGALLAVAGPARAEPLDGASVRAFMLGTKMSGVLVETGERWYECVSPAGDTVYNIEGSISTGFVEVDDAGTTCFTYPRSNETARACFRVEMEGGTRVFVDLDGGMHFRVTGLDRGFDQCLTSAPVS